jgi:chromate reductase
VAAGFVQIDDLMMYNQDLESPLPASVARFKASVEEAAAVLFVSPEHNRSIPTVLKDAIDWGTGPYGRNSSAVIALPSLARRRESSGLQFSQQQLRHVLGELGALVMGGEVYLTFKPDLIDHADTVADTKSRGSLQSFVEHFARSVARLAPTTNAAAA